MISVVLYCLHLVQKYSYLNVLLLPKVLFTDMTTHMDCPSLGTRKLALVIWEMLCAK